MPGVGLDPRLDHSRYPIRFLPPTMLRQPARRFREAQPQKPRDDGAGGADDRDPAPPVDAEWRPWDKRPGEKRGDRISRRADQRGKRERLAAPLDRYELR